MRLLEGGVVNRSTHRVLTERVFQAETLGERLRGLLGRTAHPDGEGLYLAHCRAVHTVGMRFPIDVLFLDRDGRVVRTAETMPPYRLRVAARPARDVLEVPAGTLAATGTKVGDQILINRPEGTAGASPLGTWVLNGILGILFGLLATANLTHFLSQPTTGGMALILVNGLAAWLFIFRRKVQRVTRQWSDWVITLSTLVIPWGLRVAEGPHTLLSGFGRAMQGAGFLIVICALLSLGRSFGLVPADRGLTDRGLYGWVRHPMYTGELCFFLGIVLENPMARNWVILSALFIGLPLRALAEERFLLSDSRYQSYMARVRRRFLPNIL